MCWISRNLTLKSSKKPQFVFKFLIPSTPKNVAFSAVERYKYMKDKINPKVYLIPSYNKDGTYTIYEGYHSYVECPKYCGVAHEIYLMEIPSDTDYYESVETGEIVSSNIIMRRRLTFNGKLKLIYRIMLKLGINPQKLWKYF